LPFPDLLDDPPLPFPFFDLLLLLPPLPFPSSRCCLISFRA
jgi:hypothetical protein